MRKYLLAGAAALATFAATPAFAQKETKVSTPQPQVVERVVVREVPVVVPRIDVVPAAAPAPTRRARTNEAFTGVGVGASVGVNDFDNFDDVTYEVSVGANAPLGDRFIVGAELSLADFAEDHRQLGVTGKLGAAVSTEVLLYGHAGYARADFGRNSATLDGLTYGAGAEFRLTDRVNLVTEYTRTDFGRGRRANGASIGFSFGF